MRQLIKLTGAAGGRTAFRWLDSNLDKWLDSQRTLHYLAKWLHSHLAEWLDSHLSKWLDSHLAKGLDGQPFWPCRRGMPGAGGWDQSHLCLVCLGHLRWVRQGSHVRIRRSSLECLGKLVAAAEGEFCWARYQCDLPITIHNITHIYIYTLCRWVRSLVIWWVWSVYSIY